MSLASVYWATGAWKNSLTYYNQALQGIRNSQPNSKTAELVTMTNIALCHRRLNEHEDALKQFRNVLNMNEQIFGLDHSNTVKAAENVAHTCMIMENFADAIEIFQRVLTAKQKEFGDKAEHWVSILSQLAWACFREGLYEQSLTWSSSLLSLGDQATAEQRLINMRGIALISVHQAKFDEALALYQEVLSDSKAKLGEKHWLVENVVEEMANLYLRMGAQTKALTQYQNIVEWVQIYLNRDDMKALRILAKLADVHQEQSQYDEALSLHKAVLDAVEGSSRRQEEEFVDMWRQTISEMANCHIKLFNNVNALEYLQLLLDTNEDNCHRVGALIRMGNTYEAQGNFHQAITTYERVLEEETATADPADKNVLLSVRKIGALYSRASDYGKALDWLTRALSGFRKLGELAVVEVYQTLDFMASVYYSLGRFDQGLQTQKEAMEGFYNILGPLDRSTLSASLYLANMYSGLERKEQASKLYKTTLAGYEERLKNVHPDEEDNERQAILQLQRKIQDLS